MMRQLHTISEISCAQCCDDCLLSICLCVLLDATAVASGVRAATNDDYEEEEESTAAILQHIHRPAASDNHVRGSAEE